MNDSLETIFYEEGKILMKDNSDSMEIFTRRFKSFFGVSPKICAMLWAHINDKLPENYKEVHLLWALFFLKCYNTEHVNRSFANCDEKTFRKKVWDIVLQLSLIPVVEWENRKARSNEGQTCFISLDGVDFKIQEPHPFDRKYYSHKFKSAGFRYEIGLCINTGEIVWGHGGFPCGDYPDLKIARESLVNFLEPGERVLADKGYNDPLIFILPSEENGPGHKRIMSRHETINKRMKHFKILNTTYRHSLDNHSKCFNAILNITQLIIKHEEPLFSI